jgi:hypothetical protein
MGLQDKRLVAGQWNCEILAIGDEITSTQQVEDAERRFRREKRL